MKELFITATDTDAGKTFVSCALIYALSQQVNSLTKRQCKVAAFKPVSAGCELVKEQLINEDAKLLSEFANCGQSIQNINPIAFEEAIAPHIAAKKHNKKITITEISKYYQSVKAAAKSVDVDYILTEGAGGWRLPLGSSSQESKSDSSNYQFLSDFAIAEQHQVILIVNMKLGCLNHALLTFETIKADGLTCIGWVANCASEISMSNLNENIDELEQLLPIPKIAQFNFIADVDEQGNKISFIDKIKQVASKINLAPIVS
ncbi:dethiobiotin synthase [Colwellia echini]|uniref:ATP-dependent dethiobiotin synthetase BioD n=1 Tax=Colwellia echini TaxID=1982103 RepID=A0ABY3N130_9GAMM|nr:dethiobiotin synthase [Colwellia echini]TYK66937.1 dethiobiotin synthase [Colwellia echini]